jgi:hypothetical protein
MRITLIAFTLLLAFAACNQQEGESEAMSREDSTAVWLAELDSIDTYLLNSTSLDEEKGWKAFGAFRDFARKNPKHPLAPTYHMKAAAIARNIPGKALMAIEEYTTVYQQYPQDTLAPQAQFLVGFTFDQALGDKERATKAYRAFIVAWPKHPLATQANDLIAILENDEADLDQVKGWQDQNAEN